MPQNDGGNGSALDLLDGFLQQIDVQDDELDHLRGVYMQQCCGPHEAIKDVLNSAREAHLNMKAFRTVLRKHRADRRHEKRVAALDLADQADFRTMEERLGQLADTPLGRAAMQREVDSGEKPLPAPMF
jgi:hypothetical protein